MIRERLYRHVHKLIGASQHGFVKGRSIETNLVTFLQTVVPAAHNRGQVDAMYFNMRKAFDRVAHMLLLRKVTLYGISPKYCTLLNSYLAYRRNVVRASNTLSFPFISLSGVPQESVLCPLVFILLVNDVYIHLNTHMD